MKPTYIEFGLGDLVEAWIEMKYFGSAGLGGWPREIRDYFGTKWVLLSAQFGISETAVEEAVSDRRCPFATPGLAELAARVPMFGDVFLLYSLDHEIEAVSKLYLPKIKALEIELKDTYRTWLKESLKSAFPFISERKVPLDTLIENGLPWPPPDPGDYY